jgi:phosphomannomutase
MNPTIFREYDIRGIVDQDFTPQNAFLIGQAFATIVIEKAGPRIVIGYDGRLTSPLLLEHMLQGLIAAGAEVTCIGLCPTPQLYFASQILEADGSVMITGSHNPQAFNGFKLAIQGSPLLGHAIQDLRHRIEDGALNHGKGTINHTDIQEEYVTHLLKDFQTHYCCKSMSIAWDPGNGAAANVLKCLIDKLPGQHHIINETIDGRFPNHDPDPTMPHNLTQLINLVQEKQCDIGIGFDGDGDRIGVVDANGRVVHCDQLMSLFAEEVLTQMPGSTIIADVKSSQHLFDTVERLGGIPLMWRTGRSLIKAKMTEVNCPLAGELSGHIIFSDRYYGYDDALYAALRLLGILMQKKESLVNLLNHWPHVYATSEIQIPCTDMNKFDVTCQIKTMLMQQGLSLIDIDGVRVKQEDGWWLLRPSNTQEILTARAESHSEQGLKRLLDSMAQYLAQCGIMMKVNDLIHV